MFIADHKPLPTITWQFNNATDTHINAQVKVNQQASKISIWRAYSEDRDFRDNKWTAQTLNIKQRHSLYTTPISIPESGYQAFLMEIEFQTDTGHDFKLSTAAQVTPDTKPCHCWVTGKITKTNTYNEKVD